LETIRELGTAIAHCPLSNTYFSNLPFPLRETLDAGVKVGLGTDVAGGYTFDIMTAMRQAVIMSRTRQGARVEKALLEAVPSTGESLMVHWTDALFLATRGGAAALGLSTGVFTPGAPFDAQRSEFVSML
jgi:guanine deaminase